MDKKKRRERDWVAKWQYRPATKYSRRTDAPMSVKVAWNLEEDDSAKSTDGNKNAETAPK